MNTFRNYVKFDFFVLNTAFGRQPLIKTYDITIFNTTNSSPQLLGRGVGGWVDLGLG